MVEGVNPLINVVIPVPVVNEPGVEFNVHVPEDGKPFITTEPVLIKQFGCVIAPITGVAGVIGWALTIAAVEEEDKQPLPSVTINVYVDPAAKPENDVVNPELIKGVPLGEGVIVHEPDGNPLKATDPVLFVQVG